MCYKFPCDVSTSRWGERVYLELEVELVVWDMVPMPVELGI